MTIKELIAALQKLEWQGRRVLASVDGVHGNEIEAVGEPEEAPEIIILFSASAMAKIRRDLSTEERLLSAVSQ